VNNTNLYINLLKLIQNLDNVYEMQNQEFVNKIERKLFNVNFSMNKLFDKFNEIFEIFLIRFTICVISLFMFDKTKINHFNRTITLRYVHKNSHLNEINFFDKHLIEIRKMNSLIKNIDNRIDISNRIDALTTTKKFRIRISRNLTTFVNIITSSKDDVKNVFQFMFKTKSRRKKDVSSVSK
jgi:hypothetical protein